MLFIFILSYAGLHDDDIVLSAGSCSELPFLKGRLPPSKVGCVDVRHCGMTENSVVCF